VNRAQNDRIVAKVRAAVGGVLAGRVVGAWGLTFKADTDDLRDSPALVICRRLIDEGATVQAYDPAAGEHGRHALPALELRADAYDAADGADAVVLLTEWDEFRWLDFAKVAGLLAAPHVVDARNLLDPVALRRAGFTYSGIGR
jgi:UDPglucose 6-dehydrogenase